MKVSELMTKDVRTCTAETPLIQVAKIMSEVNCGIVPVVHGGKLQGVVTDRDIVLRCIARGKDPEKTSARDVMTAEVITCGPETDAHQAANLMAEKQVRRLPVVQDDRIVGIVALGDLATVNIHVNEAGDALSSISFPSRPEAH